MNTLIKSSTSKKIFILSYAILSTIIYVYFAFHMELRVLNGDNLPVDNMNHARSGIHFFKSLFMGKKAIYEFFLSDPYPHVILYPAWHSVLVLFCFIFTHFFSENTTLAISVALANGLFLFLTHIIVVFFLLTSRKDDNSWISTALICLLSTSLLLIGPLDLSKWLGQYYLGGYTPNPWHNPTYFAIRPIALLTLFCYQRIFRLRYMASLKDYSLAGFLLALSAFFKPSFYQIFLPALTVFYIVFFLAKRTQDAFLFCLKNAISCLPVLVVGLLQMTLLPSDSTEKIGVGFLLVWKMFTPNWGLSLIATIAFPLVATIYLVISKHFDTALLLPLAIFISAILQYMFLYVVKEPRAGDFSWGLDLSLFIWLLYLIRQLRCTMDSKFNLHQLTIYFILGAIYLAHLIPGIHYYCTLFVN